MKVKRIQVELEQVRENYPEEEIRAAFGLDEGDSITSVELRFDALSSTFVPILSFRSGRQFVCFSRESLAGPVLSTVGERGHLVRVDERFLKVVSKEVGNGVVLPVVSREQLAAVLKEEVDREISQESPIRRGALVDELASILCRDGSLDEHMKQCEQRLRAAKSFVEDVISAKRPAEIADLFSQMERLLFPEEFVNIPEAYKRDWFSKLGYIVFKGIKDPGDSQEKIKRSIDQSLSDFIESMRTMQGADFAASLKLEKGEQIVRAYPTVNTKDQRIFYIIETDRRKMALLPRGMELCSFCLFEEDPRSVDPLPGGFIRPVVRTRTERGGDVVELFLPTSLKEAIYTQLQERGIAEPRYDREFIAQKIFKVLTSHQQSARFIDEIVERVLVEEMRFFEEVWQNVARDLGGDSRFLYQFSLQEGDSIVGLKALGEESHNGGKVTVLVTLKSGAQIVYKPRSVLVEKLLYQEGGVLQPLGLGSYPIHDCGKYGYTAYLKNLPEENTISSLEELDAYLDRYILLDALMKNLGASDLHALNVITAGKIPHLIDVEVVLSPAEKKTLLLAGLGIEAGWWFSEETANRIWLSDEVQQTLLQGRDIPLDSAIYERLKARRGVIQPLVSDAVRQKEEQIQAFLSQQEVRYVPIATADLNLVIQSERSQRLYEGFHESLREKLGRDGLELAISVDDLGRLLDEDILRNDVPIFYYRPNQGEVVYQGVVIGKRR